MEKILRGAPVVQDLMEKLKGRVEKLPIVPCLAILRADDNPVDSAYIRGAAKRCETLGVRLVNIAMPENCTQQELLDAVEKINSDETIHGCLILRPLPGHVDENAVCDALLPEKDMDCVGVRAISSFYAGRGGYGPCTAEACIQLLDFYGCSLSGANVAVIGRSQVIGRPVSVMLQNRDATVTMCHSKSRNLPEICRNMDIVVSAAGKAGMVGEKFVNPQQIILDVGINTDENGKLCGDVAFDKVLPLVRAVTPVPSGIGSITTAILVKHVIEAAEKAALK